MHQTPLRLAVLLAAAVPATLPAQQPPAPPTFEARPLADASWHVRFAARDSAIAGALAPVISGATRTVGAFFGEPFSQPVTVTVAPDRASFTELLKAGWGFPETECWMVALGVADQVIILSPRVWREEACEHDPADAAHLADVVTHELVHAYHGQHNPTRDFTGLDAMGWFIEGVAVLAAGQLDRNRLARPEEAVREGAVPSTLEAAWGGKYRYGVSGSLVQFVDAKVGRDRLRELLAATDQAAILAAVGLAEPELLRSWEAWVVAGRPAPDRR